MLKINKVEDFNMNADKITSINEIETEAGVFKNLIYDGAVDELYAILNLEKPPKYLYFIPADNYYNEYTEANLVMVKTDSILHIDASDVLSCEDCEEDDKEERPNTDDLKCEKKSEKMDLDGDIVINHVNPKIVKFFKENPEYTAVLSKFLGNINKYE